MRVFASCLALSVLVLSACGRGPQAPTVSAPPPEVLAIASPATAEEWQCTGTLVPPTGWQQETAFVDAKAPGARELAATQSSAKLVARVCASSGGTGCDYLTAHARVWKTGASASSVCAMAVIKSEELAEWRAMSASLSALDDKLAAATRELLKGVPSTKRVAIDQVVDIGVPGGTRADWLRARAERLVAQAATLVAVPKRWAGEGVPAGVDVVIGGSLVARQEQGIPTLEAIWTARFPGGRRVLSTPITFPEHAAPTAPAETVPPIESSAGIHLRIESARGGSLCAGDRTQLWLETDAPLYVRVFDLYGAGDALVTYPDETQPSVKTHAHEEIPLGGRLGFEAVPVPGFESERYLVVAAPTEAGLGRFAHAKGQCRVPADVGHALFRGEGIPEGAKVAVTGYRITRSPECPVASAAPHEGVTDALAALPVCNF